MSLDKFGLTVLLLGSVVFTLCGFWILFNPNANVSTIIAFLGIAFFGAGSWLFWNQLKKRNTSMSMKVSGRYNQISQLITMVIASLFNSNWQFMALLCIPLLFAWGLLYPKYTKRSVFYISCGIAILSITLQFLIISIYVYDSLTQHSNLGIIALSFSLLAIVIWLQLEVLSEMRKKYRDSKQFAIW